ncbi:MAG: hypothetical protein ACRDGN_05335 [bacterium]
MNIAYQVADDGPLDIVLIMGGHGRYLAGHIHGAKYVELQGEDHFVSVGDVDAIVNAVQEFPTGVRKAPEPDRVLATVGQPRLSAARRACAASCCYHQTQENQHAD